LLQLLDDNANYGLKDSDDQACAEAEETSEVNVFDVGRQVRVIKGNHLGKCGVISRVTKKSVFISSEGMPKDIRKSKSDKFLQIMQPIV
jgi:ribosomal protein S4E